MPRPAFLPSDAPRLPDVGTLLATVRARRKQTERDRRIAGHVFVAFERLQRGAAHESVQGLHFYVFEGTVSVYGTVLTHEQHAAVLGDLGALPGVLRVADHLRVKDRRPPAPFTIRPFAFEAS
ncbi:MAG: hypothetical protein AAGI91_09130 [Bacteroidota bacterium]